MGPMQLSTLLDVKRKRLTRRKQDRPEKNIFIDYKVNGVLKRTFSLFTIIFEMKNY